MNCQEAQNLIDQSLDRPLDRESLLDPSQDTLDSADRAALDSHLADCPNCRADLESLRRTQAMLAQLEADHPPNGTLADVWSNIRAHLATEATASEHPRWSKSEREGTRTRRRWLLPAGAGLAACLVLTCAWLIGGSEHGSEQGWGAGDGVSRWDPCEGEFTLADCFPGVPAGAPADLAFEEAEDVIYGGIVPESEQLRAELPAGEPSRSAAVPTKIQVELGDLKVHKFTAPAAPALPADKPEIAITQLGLGAFRGFALAQTPGRQADLSYGYQGAIALGRLGPLAANIRKGDPLEAPPRPGTRAAQRPAAPAIKLIKTAQLALEVPKFDEAAGRVREVVTQHQGFVADSTIEEMTGGAIRAVLVIRVAPESFEALFAELRKIGRVEKEDIKTQDVTAAYVDLQARIKNAEASEERLRDLIKSKSILDKIANLLEVEKELARVRGQIETMQGQLRVMAGRIGLSTIHLTLREPARTVPSASLSVEVETLAQAREQLAATLTTLGGQIVSGQTKNREDGSLMAEYKLRVALPKFADLIDAIGALGRVADKKLADQPFGAKIPEGSETIQCELALVVFERSRQLPTGSLAFEVAGVAEATAKLRAALEAVSGGVVSSQTSLRTDGSSATMLSVRVPAGRFRELLDSLAALGRQTAANVRGETEGIEGGAAEVPCTIALELSERPGQVPSANVTIQVKDFASARDHLRDAIAGQEAALLSSGSTQRTDGTWSASFRIGVKARDMDAVVKKLESLGTIKSRQAQGLGLADLANIGRDVRGEITLSLEEPPAILPESDRSSGKARRMISDALAGLYTSLLSILYGLIILSPWLLIAAGATFVVIRIRRRRMARARADEGDGA